MKHQWCLMYFWFFLPASRNDFFSREQCNYRSKSEPHNHSLTSEKKSYKTQQNDLWGCLQWPRMYVGNLMCTHTGVHALHIHKACTIHSHWPFTIITKLHFLYERVWKGQYKVKVHVSLRLRGTAGFIFPTTGLQFLYFFWVELKV